MRIVHKHVHIVFAHRPMKSPRHKLYSREGKPLNILASFMSSTCDVDKKYNSILKIPWSSLSFLTKRARHRENIFHSKG